MTTKKQKVPFEVPKSWILMVDCGSVICASWENGYIPDEDYNYFDLDD